MSRLLRVVLALAVIQALAASVYWLARDSSPPAPREFVIERFSGKEAAPALIVEDRAGNKHLIEPVRWRLIHFWATWCPPCREELPALQALKPEEIGGIDVLLVATDRDWRAIDQFLGGKNLSTVVRLDDSEALDRFGVSTLPDSYLVSPQGRLVARIFGARDWSSAEAREALKKEISSWK